MERPFRFVEVLLLGDALSDEALETVLHSIRELLANRGNVSAVCLPRKLCGRGLSLHLHQVGLVLGDYILSGGEVDNEVFRVLTKWEGVARQSVEREEEHIDGTYRGII